MAKTTKKSLLWRLTHPDIPHASYLFGTMHVRDLRAFRWAGTAKQCMQHCAVFATEFDFRETDEAALLAALRLPEGVDLEILLGRRNWKNLDRYLEDKLHTGAEAFRHAHPMSVSTALSMAFFGEESAHSLDESLWQYAQQIGLPVTGVERFEHQLDTLRSIPLEQHVKGLVWMLKHFRQQKKNMARMMRHYVDGNIDALYRASKKSAKGMRKALIYKRNKAMAQRFHEIAGEKSLFCAIGAAHLAGGKGLLRLLKKQGYRAKPVLPESVPLP